MVRRSSVAIVPNRPGAQCAVRAGNRRAMALGSPHVDFHGGRCPDGEWGSHRLPRRGRSGNHHESRRDRSSPKGCAVPLATRPRKNRSRQQQRARARARRPPRAIRSFCRRRSRRVDPAPARSVPLHRGLRRQDQPISVPPETKSSGDGPRRRNLTVTPIARYRAISARRWPARLLTSRT